MLLDDGIHVNMFALRLIVCIILSAIQEDFYGVGEDRGTWFLVNDAASSEDLRVCVVTESGYVHLFFDTYRCSMEEVYVYHEVHLDWRI